MFAPAERVRAPCACPGPAARYLAGMPDAVTGEHAPHNAMDDPGEIARFHDRCSELMRRLLGELAAAPEQPRPFPEIEDAIAWPHRRIASVLGGVCRLRQTEFGGRRPYRFLDPGHSASGRWELWMDGAQQRAIRTAQRTDRTELRPAPSARR
jgi:hypothetical protein